ncbi:MAG TPA: AMP-binding protein [Acidimicrobiales bacterium]
MGALDWNLRSVPAEDVTRYVADGWWTDDPLGRRLVSGLREHRSLPFVVHSRSRPWSGTLGDVLDLALRLAGGLHARGVEPGDVVSFQLPNWMEAAATFYAASFLGAVVVPIVHFYGGKEVGYILGESEPRVHVTTPAFGHQDFDANLATLDLGGTEVVMLGEASFDALAAADPLAAPLAVDPSAPALVGWTSGTTANPKGVIHSHRTIWSEVRQLSAAQPPFPRPNIVGAPVGHAIGMLSALLTPLELGQAIHLTDVWDPGAILRTMVEHDLGLGGGATFFFTSLLDHPDFTDAHLQRMAYAGMGGSSVPRAVAERLTEMGITVYRMYGSTEHPSITGCTYVDPLEKRLASDGPPLPGVRIRLVDEDGSDVAPGEPGEILSRGPDCFVGYTDPALTAQVFDADGWYHTGDIGVADSEGYVTITDRKSDVIIRGGENISAAEVEELLLRVPGVAEAAVVAAPDARLGEHACAFLRLLPEASMPDLPAVRSALEQAGLARQKWPEELVEIGEFPRTASGKVQKFALRSRLRG